ncbi:MAG: hypothetical protein AAFV07_07725, partial [Bacteroidota bacterium]
MTQIAPNVAPLPTAASSSGATDVTTAEARRLLWLLKARANVNGWDIQDELKQLELIMEAYAWAS